MLEVLSGVDRKGAEGRRHGGSFSEKSPLGDVGASLGDVWGKSSPSGSRASRLSKRKRNRTQGFRAWLILGITKEVCFVLFSFLFM